MWCKGEETGCCTGAVTIRISAMSKFPFSERTTVGSCILLDPS